MIINDAGEYTLKYTATDACGNSTVVERGLTVEAPPRTVLYTDGTFIINELGEDQATNTALHGQPIDVFAPFDPNGATDKDKYIFSGSDGRDWATYSRQVVSVEIGSLISPTSTAWWFYNFENCTSMDLTNLDTSNVTSMVNMFYFCQSLTSLDVSGFDTSSVTNMNSMFAQMSALVTIYASELFVVDQVTNSSYMFDDCVSLVGGAGTTYRATYKTKSRARIDNPPDAPGYFTARP